MDIVGLGGRSKIICFFFFFNDTATTEIYTRSIVGSVRCVQETENILSSLSYTLFIQKVSKKIINSFENWVRYACITRTLYVFYSIFLVFQSVLYQQNNAVIAEPMITIQSSEIDFKQIFFTSIAHIFYTFLRKSFSRFWHTWFCQYTIYLLIGLSTLSRGSGLQQSNF
eukprot:TRINITY_DN24519_c0_g1_i1.p2 TRINITY_DN24519_c0_g1~~TRINITY_DN24519_c0_g1_i1.p2  ORF type:complete len:169 (+),score=12.28 TRINITY_DN24519_c0_g1_i1:47-553(+)